MTPTHKNVGNEILRGIRVLHLAAADSMLNPNLREQVIFLRDEMGCDVSTASIDGPLARRLRDEDGFEWTPLPLSREMAPLSDLRAVRWIQNFCREKKFDIVHTHTPKGNLVGQWGAKLAGTPVVLQTLHGFYFHDRMAWAARHAWIEIERFSARHSDHILCQNPEDVETAVRERIVERSRITALGNGIDLQKFKPVDEAAQRAAKARIGIPEDALVVGMVGRFVREKGYEEFLKAGSYICRRHEKICFLSIGHRVASERIGDRLFECDVEGKMRAVRGKCDEELVSDRMIALFDRHDMPELYAAMDIHVLPSYREGFPRSLIEGAATGLPQVATNIRGCRQAVSDGVTGFLVEPGFAGWPELASRIEELLGNEGLRKKMGQKARQLAENQFDQRAVFRRVACCYAELIGGVPWIG